MRFRGGYLRIGRFAGVPVRLHVTTPFGVWALGGFTYAPGAWAALAGLFVAHEVGHAVLVRRAGLTIDAIEVHGFGGECRWSGQASPETRARIAWGGVLAQIVVLLVAACVTPLVGTGPLRAQILDTLTVTNLLLAGLNLIPIAPLDGAEAWKVVRYLVARDGGRRGATRGRREDLLRRAEEIERELEAMRRGDRDD
jgi:Zn-dependent protease